MKRCLLICGMAAILMQVVKVPAQEEKPSKPVVHVDVNLVLLNVAVIDDKGHYVTGLSPADFTVTEDNIPQKLATFGEGDAPQRPVDEILNDANQKPNSPRASADTPGSPIAGANVFILFDTSNYMYRNFALAQDAIAEFARSLDTPERVAFYSYSRDLYRAAKLTNDRTQVLRGVRSTTAGDSPALYNALLLTLKDAGQYPGRKVIVVFSNGPDTASMAAPEDISELAQSEGIPIYVISTTEAKQDPISTMVFQRMTLATGGEVYFAKNWKRQQQAFSTIRDDVAHLYSLSYYPKSNPNHGWRAIKVKLTGAAARKYHVRTRSGYRPKLARVSNTTP
jgi:Ca-activated chloride channel family protein